MAETVFYAWQSDLPGNETHYILGRALEAACEAVSTDPGLVPVQPDRDTQDVPGAPDISATIFDKIQRAVAVVADVSIVTPALLADGSRGEGRLTPNPNVLVELGYAKGALDPSAVVLVMNTDFGAVEDLPFDLRPRRVVRFSTKGGSKKQTEKDLASRLASELRAILAGRAVADDLDDDALVAAIEAQAPDRRARARRFVDALVRGFDQHAPRFSEHPFWAQREILSDGDGRFRADEVWKTVVAFSPGLAAVARVAQATALAADETIAGELLRLLERLVERYQPPRGVSGSFGGRIEAELDVYRALGYEVALILASTYLQEEAWSLLKALVNVRLRPDNIDVSSVGLGYAAQETPTLAALQDPRVRNPSRASRGWLTQEMHDGDDLRGLVSRAQAVEADVLLTLHTLEVPDAEWESQWYPYAIERLQRDDLRFLRRATDKAYAARLANALGIETVEALRQRLSALSDRIRRMEVPDRSVLLAFQGAAAVGTE